MMAALISRGGFYPGRRRNLCPSSPQIDNQTVESLSLKKKRELNGAETGRGLRTWLDRRYQITPLFEFLQHKQVPIGVHWMGWYYLGGITMFFFIVQVVTGVLLLMYYQPGETTAYESIHFLTTKVPFGWLIRSIHSWSAHLMIISLVFHMFSTMMLKAYRPPREVTWVSGYFLFLLTMGFGFSGYTLREVSVNASEPGFQPRLRMMAQEAKAAADASVPVEPGKSTVVVTVSGSVQLR